MPLHKITANYTDAASDALAEAIRLGRNNQTDTLNRAIQLYAMLLRETVENGKKVSIHDGQPVTVAIDPNTGKATINFDYETLTIRP